VWTLKKLQEKSRKNCHGADCILVLLACCQQKLSSSFSIPAASAIMASPLLHQHSANERYLHPQSVSHMLSPLSSSHSPPTLLHTAGSTPQTQASLYLNPSHQYASPIFKPLQPPLSSTGSAQTQSKQGNKSTDNRQHDFSVRLHEELRALVQYHHDKSARKSKLSFQLENVERRGESYPKLMLTMWSSYAVASPAATQEWDFLGITEQAIASSAPKWGRCIEVKFNPAHSSRRELKVSFHDTSHLDGNEASMLQQEVSVAKTSEAISALLKTNSVRRIGKVVFKESELLQEISTTALGDKKISRVPSITHPGKIVQVLVSKPLGVKLTKAGLIIKKIEKGYGVDGWNTEHPRNAIFPEDRITAVKFSSGKWEDVESLTSRQLKKVMKEKCLQSFVEMKLYKPNKPSKDMKTPSGQPCFFRPVSMRKNMRNTQERPPLLKITGKASFDQEQQQKELEASIRKKRASLYREMTAARSFAAQSMEALSHPKSFSSLPFSQSCSSLPSQSSESSTVAHSGSPALTPFASDLQPRVTHTVGISTNHSPSQESSTQTIFLHGARFHGASGASSPWKFAGTRTLGSDSCISTDTAGGNKYSKLHSNSMASINYAPATIATATSVTSSRKT
jgi:hypothetical protein